MDDNRFLLTNVVCVFAFIFSEELKDHTETTWKTKANAFTAMRISRL